MAQSIDFNWVLKVKNPETYQKRRRGVEVKGGYRVFPMSWPIAISDWEYNIIAKLRVVQVMIKHQTDITNEDAKLAGFSELESLLEYLKAEYPEGKHLATFIWFELISDKDESAELSAQLG